MSQLQATPKTTICNTRRLLNLLEIILPGKKRQDISKYLYRNYRDTAKALEIKGMVIRYAGQPKGLGSQHNWSVDASGATAELKQIFAKFQRKSQAIVPTTPAPERNQGQNASIEWNGLFFRSPAEVRVAEALERQKLLFFPNARCRVVDRRGSKETIEVDFLVVWAGRAAILEVDGATYHPSAAADHQRDRVFLRQGVLCCRFSAGECDRDPDGVVAEFLEMLAAR